MKIKDKKFYGTPELLQKLKEEAEFIGRYCSIEGDCLTVHAITPRKPKKRDREKVERDKRREKFEHRNITQE